jgi:hypothetical protein
VGELDPLALEADDLFTDGGLERVARRCDDERPRWRSSRRRNGQRIESLGGELVEPPGEKHFGVGWDLERLTRLGQASLLQRAPDLEREQGISAGGFVHAK